MLVIKKMIHDLQDEPPRKKQKSFPSFSRRARVRFDAPRLPKIVDMASDAVKKELKEALLQAAVQGLQKTIEPAKSDLLRAEFDQSQAIPELMQKYAGFVDNVPGPLQLALLIGQKWAKVALT